MRIIAVIVFVFSLHVSAKTLGQNVSIKKQNITLKEVFKELRNQTGYYFIYNSKEVADEKRVSTNFSNAPIDVVLSSVLKGMSLSYTIEDKIISLKPATDNRDNTALENVNQQDRTITGKIIDAEDNSPLYGVSVRVKGSVVGTMTNGEGEFSVKVKASDKVLVFTYIGYVTKELPLTSALKYEVTLARDSKQLDEVVIAFGTSTKAELTNSVTKISAKDIEQRPISNLNSAIVGASPGVQTTAGSGQPGEGPVVRIRGFGSITGDNDPLYVLDGAPYEGVISNINAEDIDNISILKDASATALYGARAANGVIMITTKRGSSTGKTNITAKFTQAFSNRGLPNYETLNAYEYFPVVWEGIRNSVLGTSVNPADSLAAATAATNGLIGYVGWNPFNVANDEIVLGNGLLNPNAKLLYPDDLSFGKELQRLGMRSDMSLSVSGGSAKTDHFVSVNYLDENGYVKGSDFKRFSGRLRVNAAASDWLKFGLNMFGTYTKSDQANESSGINENPFYVDLIMAPIYPVYKHDPITGAYLLDSKGNKIFDNGDYRPLFTGRNVVYETLYNVNQDRRNSLNGVANVEAKFLKDFKFTSNFSYNLGNFRGVAYDNSVMGDAIGAGRTIRINTTTAYLNFNQLLNWSKTFNKHKVSLLLGHENYWSYYDYFRGAKRMEGIEGLPVLDNMTTTTALGSYDRDYRTEGYLSKLDYSYKSKYILSASFRYDGSSRFHPDYRWGKFWSVSGAYNIDREKFFKVKWIDNLKIRGSYGEVGNDRTGTYFTYMNLYTLGYDNGSEPGMIFTQLGNDRLRWETNFNADVAVEVSAFKNRFGATIEAFRRQSKNLLFDINMPLTSGVLTRDDNFGSMRNQGIELQLNGVPVKTKSFNWSVVFNATTLENKIMSLPDSYINRQNGTKRYNVGRSLYDYWLYDFVMVNPNNGANLYRPVDKTTTTNRVIIGADTLTSGTANAQYYYAGSAIPDFFGSINNTFTYKNWSLQALVIYQIGGYTYDNDYQSLMFRGSTSATSNGRAMHKDMLTRWQKPGDISTVNKVDITASYLSQSDRWLTSSNYLNLRTVALTYSFPKKTVARLKLTNAKAYVNGENLFITSKRRGLDPTQTYTGSASYTYAPSRIVSFGLNLTL
ncbi:MAG: SusC/RagA family TonB-linked outer membrane protein [Pedobacter sp.]|uniref:SusC/RagA family TonB-linked outer membrane protein n=1 Tax=Pedobacter sp. TaxID=1411316 RepID=UPI0028083546|nr:SusC/RagA family TonB-linked outer membrane protein [Pedobacter sp.]MDQ8006617.1 SusC/RagA family TonB-linked outer membrane protein [Pedobacter sp.]